MILLQFKLYSGFFEDIELLKENLNKFELYSYYKCTLSSVQVNSFIELEHKLFVVSAQTIIPLVSMFPAWLKCARDGNGDIGDCCCCL